LRSLLESATIESRPSARAAHLSIAAFVHLETDESAGQGERTIVEKPPATIAFADTNRSPPTTGMPGSESAASLRTDHSRGEQRYRVLRPHAKGGLGSVSVAFDTELSREVALKEILPHLADQADGRARFTAEAEITGRLEHPGIVPVYGMGAYADGRPYYAMRFIHGESLSEAIDAYHRARKLSPKRTEHALELRRLLRHFLDACNAIHYAHSRGVLHRDIKPANIMLGKFGETLVVDWGLAKVLGELGKSTSDEAQGSMVRPSNPAVHDPTLVGYAVGTPAYMSPEQARGDMDELGPTSDVWSLGATLYYLLTGQAPYSGKTGEVIDKASSGNFVPPRQRDPSVAAGLDAICKKAMSKSPEDRYQSARDLADDITRWTADEVVLAYREPWSARLARWARRNRGWTQGAAAALILTTIVAVTAALLVNRARTREMAALDTEKAVSAFLIDLFEDSDPMGFASASHEFRVSSTSADRTARELLKDGAQRLKTELIDQPAARAKFLETIGNVYRGLGMYEEATQILRESLDLRRAHLADDQAAIALNLRNLAWSIHYSGRYKEAAPMYAQALAMIEEHLGAEHLEVASTKLQLALLLTEHEMGEYEKSLRMLDEVIEMRRRLLGPGSQGVAIALASKAAVHFQRGDEERAKDCVVQLSLILSQGNVAEAGLTLATYTQGLAAQGEDDSKRACELLAEAVRLAGRVLGKKHPMVAIVMADYGAALISDRQYEKAEVILERVNTLVRELRVREDHPKLSTLRRDFARLYLETGRGEKARKMLEANLQDALQATGDRSRRYATACQEFGYVLNKLGHTEEAIVHLRRALAIAKSIDAERPERIAFFSEELALVLAGQGRHSEAIELLQEAVVQRRRDKSNPTRLGESLVLLGQAQLRDRQWAAAQTTLADAKEQFLNYSKSDWTARAQALMGEALWRDGQRERAKKELTEALAVIGPARSAAHEWNQHARQTLALLEESGAAKGANARESPAAGANNPQ
jgi:serine/threonine protein kinase